MNKGGAIVRGAASLLLQIVALAVAYVAVAQVGLALTHGQGLVSPDWITTGLAVATLGLKRGHLWPGITLGAFIAYAGAGNPVPVAAGIAVGNTLEAWVGGWMLRRFGMVGEISRIRDVAALVATALAAPLPSATGGVLGPFLDGLLPWAEVGSRWVTWWIGDAIGVVLLAPPLLAWFGARSPATRPPHSLEAAAALAVGVAGIIAGFVGEPYAVKLGVERIPLALFVFPPVVWAAVRLPPRQAVLTPTAMAMLAIGLTFAGIGPFSHGGPLSNLVVVQLAFGATVATMLVLVGAIANLEEAVRQAGDATRRAEDAMRQAQEASLAKSRFVAAVRHDLAQPLQAIRLFLRALSGGRLDARDRLLVERIAGGIEAMGAALDSLKDITAVELELVRPAPTSFPVGELLAQLVEEWRPQAAEKGLAFRFMPCACAVNTDRQMLGRILRNLLANAVRYTAHGRVLLGCRHTSGNVRIEVWDTGPGIPPEEQEAIFETFHRAPGGAGPQTAGEAGGLGLGLATVRRLAAVLDLPVTVRSTVGKGSVFSVGVPRS